MKEFKSISTTPNVIMIKHKSLDFVYGIKEGHRYFNNLNMASTFYHLSHYSKNKLIEVQSILLKAYVYCHDELDEGIEKSVSIEDLKVTKENILGVRQALKEITKYLQSYDSLLTEFKEI